MSPLPRVDRSLGFDADNECPVDAALSVIGGKWKGSILWRLSSNGPMRPGELRRSILGVDERVLARQLGELVDDGIVDRHEASGFPLHVTYELSDYGRTVGPVVEQLCAWGRSHQARA